MPGTDSSIFVYYHIQLHNNPLREMALPQFKKEKIELSGVYGDTKSNC